MEKKDISIRLGEVGFCGGVSRADTMIQDIRSKEQGPIYIFGELIHNSFYKETLKEQNIFSIFSIEEAKDKIIIIRTHGISPEEEKQIYSLAKKVYDLTCPLVKSIQSKAKKYSDEGYFILIAGDPNHAETIGIVGYIKEYKVIKYKEQLDEIDFNKHAKMVFLSQSTFSQDIFLDLISLVKEKKMDIYIENTLCYAPTNRQDEMVFLAKENDMIIVIGGVHSSNTIKLFEKAKIESNTGKVYHIELPSEINNIDFTNIKSVGIASGTSTPDFLIQELVEKLNAVNLIVNTL